MLSAPGWKVTWLRMITGLGLSSLPPSFGEASPSFAPQLEQLPCSTLASLRRSPLRRSPLPTQLFYAPLGLVHGSVYHTLLASLGVDQVGSSRLQDNWPRHLLDSMQVSRAPQSGVPGGGPGVRLGARFSFILQ